MTVAMERDDGEVLYFGSVCATRHSGRELPIIRIEAQAIRTAKMEAAKKEYKAHPARIALDVKIAQANREGVPAGRAFREYLGDTVLADAAALHEIRVKYGVPIHSY
jgi:hypothetical protein